MTICHYLSLQEPQRELLKPSSTDLSKWFLDSLRHSGLCRTPDPNPQMGLSTAVLEKPRLLSPERAQMLRVLRKPLRLPLPSRLQKVRNCLQESQLSRYTARVQISLFTYPGAMLLQFNGVDRLALNIRRNKKRQGLWELINNRAYQNLLHHCWVPRVHR